MAPDVSQMGSLIDQYREAGQAVPKSLMEGYKEAIEVGAAAGDVDAAWQNYANQILESGSEENEERFDGSEQSNVRKCTRAVAGGTQNCH